MTECGTEVTFLMKNWLLSGFSLFVEGLRGSKGGVEGELMGIIEIGGTEVSFILLLNERSNKYEVNIILMTLEVCKA